MKKLLIAVSALVSALALNAASVACQSISYSTPGPDTYQDGTVVLDGEVYAIVWSAAGFEFAGFKADGSLVDTANNKLIKALPFAKGGKCPPVIVNIMDTYIAENGLANGSFAVYLLDTRKFNNGAATVAGVNKNGALTLVNAASVAVETLALSPSAANDAAPEQGVAAVDASALPPNVPQPRITAIDLLGDDVVLTVEGTVSYINYAAQVGKTPVVNGAVGAASVGGGTIKVVAPKTSDPSAFYGIIRK